MLSHRQRLILHAIVDDYVRSAEPVGSRTLSKHHDIQFSAATIRNEMADLEELGYLDQPHTSAGRVPSQKGYRFYVDNLMDEPSVDRKTVATLRSLFEQKLSEMERLIQQTAQVVSHITQQTSVVLGPRTHQERVRKIEMIPIAPSRAVVILVTDTGHVQDRQVQLSDDVAGEDIASLVKLLNDKLVGVPISRLRSRLHRVASAELSTLLASYEDALAFLDELSEASQRSHQVYIGGAANILAQPEFRDVDKVRPLFELFERTEELGNLLPNAERGSIGVRIGSENVALPLQDCAVIGAEYRIGNEVVGRLGVIGPTRMDYARIVKVLDYAARALSKLLTERNDFGG
ncbi:heat-inducible transcriptional repressor HrcA [Alicyclobacillus tolerans]|uniref:Heat-inducible transcription repressor HrcA n=2 Tax=Alicyclobacillus tolerans TaxID=90970 RepID=A0A1M6JY48_9BACL|nr:MULTISPECIES: heat-inducible transcriptional repressor HrcA [Alicyclobacillus]MDP9727368.1 heat-inducible transcriptional repressor [Alicyclobacillus tengchongensis]QRF23107.1 heat-inducible transcription repressor HrcA [Alicyclobacillus sp. TC]SHJ51583.1 heat-inducible transcription repressor HrcA [Alicyclobacillus montanus]